MMVRDRVGGGGSEKLELAAGWIGFGLDAGMLARVWPIAGGGRLKFLSDDCEMVASFSLPGISPEAAGVGGSVVRGMAGLVWRI